MVSIPQEYENSICEIRSLKNEMIATGTISRITKEYIEIANKSQNVAMMRYGTVVKINVFNYRKGIRVLVGKVYISSLQFMRITDIVTILDYERRHFFRVSTEIEAKVIIPVNAKDKTANKQENSSNDASNFETLDVKVINLSLGGVLFKSDHAFSKGEKLIIDFKLDRHKCSFKCTVGRIEETDDNKILYGCRFIEATDAETSALCAFIFQRQREQINRKDL